MAQLDRQGGLPLYRQIADHLRSQILSGEREGGEKLPPIRDLEELYDVSAGTVRQAVDLLKSEGLVVARHGSGIFVRERPPIRRLAHDRFSRSHRDAGQAPYLAEMEREGWRPRVEILEIGRSAPPAEIRDRLELQEGDQDVLVRYRRYWADDEPVQVATSYLAWDLVEGTQIVEEDTGPGGIYARLEELGHQLVGFEEELHARAALGEETRLLQLEAGVPVLNVIRTAFAEEGPVEVCDTLMRADRFRLSYRLPAD